MTCRTLILGASGMLGGAMLQVLAGSGSLEVVGVSRRPVAAHLKGAAEVRTGVDLEGADSLAALLAEVRPDVIVNCVGVVKQLTGATDPLVILPVNALLPHRLARLAGMIGARLIHISTDCVFDGSVGNYRESDAPSAMDLYGISKLLGEVGEAHTITLRTSIIGHEQGTRHGLLEWFLSQQAEVRGYTRAVFSGLPTVELARIVRDFVLPNGGLSGLYHVSADPISKFELLRLIAQVYEREVTILPSDEIIIDRSLDSSRFRAATGYSPPAWPDLVAAMRRDQLTAAI